MGSTNTKSRNDLLFSSVVEDRQKLTELWNIYDTDKNGFIEKSEATKLFEDIYEYLRSNSGIIIGKEEAFTIWEKFLGLGKIDRQSFSRVVQIIRNKGLVSEKDVIFVGAGPVGLWTAIQLKILRPECRVIMYERHAKYVRSHLLRLEKLTTFCAVPRDKRLQDLTDKLPASIRTNDLEEQFLNLAAILGIEIRIEKVLSKEHLLTLAGDAKVIVGSDGSRSSVRQFFFGEKMRTLECLRCIVDLKYEVEGTTKALDLITQSYALLKKLPFLVEEHVGKISKDGLSPVTIRFIVDEKLYDERLKEASFANPFIFPRDIEKLGTLKQAVFMWLNARKEYLGEKRRPGSEKMTAVKLSIYEAEKVCIKDEKDRYIFLVGDAAFGVPFFRALNNGLLCSSKLAHCIADKFTHQQGQEKAPPPVFTPFSMLGDMYTSTYNMTTNAIHDLHRWSTALGSSTKAYEQFVSSLAALEIPRARVKSNALGAIKQGLTVANMLPSEIQVKTVPPEVQLRWSRNPFEMVITTYTEVQKPDEIVVSTVTEVQKPDEIVVTTETDVQKPDEIVITTETGFLEVQKPVKIKAFTGGDLEDDWDDLGSM